MPARDLALDTLVGRARRRDPRPQPLLPRRRDGDHDRYGARSSASTSPPSTTRSRPTRSPTCSRANGICAAMWADWWGFKMEAYDAINENIPLVHNAGACAIVHSDDANGIQRLNQEAAKALADGRRMGINITDEVAWRWLAINPAKALGIADQTGSLKPGKMADVVLWNGNPFSVYTRPRAGLDRRRPDVRHEQSAAAAGQRLRARPARRRRREMIARLLARRCAARRSPQRPPPRRPSRSPAARSRIGDGSRADRRRHRRHPRRPRSSPPAPNVAVPAGAQVIDARGKWVTPGIVAGFSRIGLVEVDAVDATNDTQADDVAVQRRDRRRAGDQSAGHRRSRSTAPPA